MAGVLILHEGSWVRAVETIREVHKGDTGIVVAGWDKQVIAVRWDKDQLIRRVNRKRVEKV